MGAIGSGNLVDGSAALTLGGTSEEVFTANKGRQYLFIQNVSAGDLWVNFGTAAVINQPSIKLIPNASLEYSESGTGVVPTGAVNINGATTGQSFTAKEA